MKTSAGVWIDHRKAIVVTATDDGDEVEMVVSTIVSSVESQPRRSPGSRSSGSFESQKVSADDSRQKASTGHLNIYYDAVIAGIQNAESILIFGPGEAKGELSKRLKVANLDGRVVGVETVDKMTERQIEAKVHEYFAKKRPKTGTR